MSISFMILKKLLIGMVFLIWLWAGWLGYECHRLKASSGNSEVADEKSEYIAQTKDGIPSNANGSSAERIRELQERLRDSEEAARKATEEWRRFHAANAYVHWMENIPTQDITLDDLKSLAPDEYHKVLKLIHDRNERYAQRKQERQSFVEAIRAEWLTSEEHRQLRTYFQLIDAFEDDNLNKGKLDVDERKRLKEKAPSYWKIQEIEKKCCHRMVGDDDGAEERLEKEVEEIRSVFKAPYYEFILPEPTIMKTSR